MPRNQRRYVWTRRNWQELLDDILLVENGTEKTHFIGSIVLYCEKDRENGISHYTIIDGQQTHNHTYNYSFQYRFLA